MSTTVLIIITTETISLDQELMTTKRKWVVALISVNEEALRKGALTLLPDILAKSMEEALPLDALELECVYLHSADVKPQLVATLEKFSLPYHTYASDVMGEGCTQPFCRVHPGGTGGSTYCN